MKPMGVVFQFSSNDKAYFGLFQNDFIKYKSDPESMKIEQLVILFDENFNRVPYELYDELESEIVNYIGG